MKAVCVREHGGLDALELIEREAPEPGPGEVRIGIHYAALNHLDLWVRKGVPGHRFPLPLVLGSDGSGEVLECGPGVEGLAPGTRVVCFPATSCGHCEACLSGRDQFCRQYKILGEARDGVMAEEVVLPRANVHPIPESLSLEMAAAFPLTFLTAWTMLVRRARLQAGETVLIQAAGSGVSSAGIQIAKLLGARVLATTGGSAKAARARALGADEVIDYHCEDFVRRVKELSSGKGVEVVFDHVGKDTFEGSLRCLAWGGRYVTCGATTGSKVDLHLNALFFKSLSLLGSTMGSKGDLCRILDLVVAGKLKPVIGEVLKGLDQVPRGHRLLEERKVFGKVLIEIKGDVHG
ncbi:MAG TPA: alcohol dehydrogenase [Planctomycetes bacterium]|nr:alcohol dehydrogenase [Planctomycetota bacterium]